MFYSPTSVLSSAQLPVNIFHLIVKGTPTPFFSYVLGLKKIVDDNFMRFLIAIYNGFYQNTVLA